MFSSYVYMYVCMYACMYGANYNTSHGILTRTSKKGSTSTSNSKKSVFSICVSASTLIFALTNFADVGLTEKTKSTLKANKNNIQVSIRSLKKYTHSTVHTVHTVHIHMYVNYLHEKSTSSSTSMGLSISSSK
jgi:hypothetical protein